jgi:hypothetical protein
MPKGKSWTLTDRRRGIVLDMLKRQHTLQSIAGYFGVGLKLITKVLRAEGINWREERLNGLANLRAKMFERLDNIDRDDRFVDLSLKVLDKYDVAVEEVVDNSTPTDSAVAAKILKELGK